MIVRRVTISLLLAATTATALACGSDSKAAGGIGSVCDDGTPCGTSMFCYSGNTPQIVGQCTENCTASATSDSCKTADPNTACLVAGVCGRECGNGLACPTGTTCNTTYAICEHH